MVFKGCGERVGRSGRGLTQRRSAAEKKQRAEKRRAVGGAPVPLAERDLPGRPW
jgi:hypothetical protein